MDKYPEHASNERLKVDEKEDELLQRENRLHGNNICSQLSEQLQVNMF